MSSKTTFFYIIAFQPQNSRDYKSITRKVSPIETGTHNKGM